MTGQHGISESIIAVGKLKFPKSFFDLGKPREMRTFLQPATSAYLQTRGFSETMFWTLNNWRRRAAGTALESQRERALTVLPAGPFETAPRKERPCVMMTFRVRLAVWIIQLLVLVAGHLAKLPHR
jgi:hypothetical protein